MGLQVLHSLLGSRSQILVIGAHDGLSGRLGERAGFDALWASGFEVSACHGVPDANLLDMSAQLTASSQIEQAVSIPVIADCDSGYGNASNAAFTARKFARAGIAGISIEDNAFPKTCSFYEGTRRALVSAAEHALKVKACKEATAGELFLIARTEALIAGRGMAEALERAEAYVEAGADAILVHSKKTSPEEMIEFANHWKGQAPLVAVPTTYDTIAASELGRMGYRIVIFANQGLRASIKAMEDAYARLLPAGRACVLNADIASLQKVFDLVGVRELEESERKFLPASKPHSKGTRHAE